MPNRVVDNFNVRVADVLSYSSAVHRTKIALITKKYSKTLLILGWFPPKEFYKLPVTVEKKSWSFPYFCKSYSQRKIGTFLWATLYIWMFLYIIYLYRQHLTRKRSFFAFFTRDLWNSCRNLAETVNRQFLIIDKTLIKTN